MLYLGDLVGYRRIRVMFWRHSVLDNISKVLDARIPDATELARRPPTLVLALYVRGFCSVRASVTRTHVPRILLCRSANFRSSDVCIKDHEKVNRSVFNVSTLVSVTGSPAVLVLGVPIPPVKKSNKEEKSVAGETTSTETTFPCRSECEWIHSDRGRSIHICRSPHPPRPQDGEKIENNRWCVNSS